MSTIEKKLNLIAKVIDYPYPGIGFVVEISGLNSRLLEICKEAEKNFLEEYATSEKFEELANSLKILFDLGEDIMESSFWVKNDILTFDTGN